MRNCILLINFPLLTRLVFGLTVASLIYVLFVLPVAIADYAISTEWYIELKLSSIFTSKSEVLE